MALKFGRLTLIPLGILVALPACGKKTAENENFLPYLSDITLEDVLSESQLATNEVLEKTFAALGISDIDTSSAAAIPASLKTPSTYITDSTKATTWAATRAATIVGNADAQKCDSISAFVDLAPGTNYGITGNGAFKIGTDGLTPTNLLTGSPLDALKAYGTAKVYLMKYKLKGDTDNRNAFVTIPNNSAAALAAVATYGATLKGALTVAPDGSTNNGYPMAFYAHAGATGLAYEEIAQTFGDMQASHIIVAPVFPGEPACATYDTDATTGKKVPTCTGANIASPAVGTSNPYTNDVTDLLGAYECMKANLSSATLPVLNTAGTATGVLSPLGLKYVAVSAAVSGTAGVYQTSLTNAGQTASAAKAGKIKLLALSPVAYVVGLGRGAAVAQLAIGRGGALNSVMFSTATDAATVGAQTALNTAGVTPGMFSCSITASPQSTFTAGLNKVILNYWVRGESGLLTAAQQAALTRVPGFANIKANIDAIKAAGGSSDEQAAAIAKYVESIDSTFHMGLVHGGLQNWGKVMQSNTKLIEAALTSSAAAQTSATATLAAAQGSGLILHGTADLVANVSNSQLFSGIAVQTSASLEAATTRQVGGVNWLALGIAPPTATTVNGTTDFGHVSDVSFLTGKAVAAATSSMTSDSSYTIADYVDKMPTEIIAAWLTSCKGSLSATAN